MYLYKKHIFWFFFGDFMDWQSARWIWLDENACKDSMQVMFQRDFRLDELPEQAELYITCDSVYRLRINGQWCADGPGRHFPESCPFDTIDCSSMLRSGLNRLEADVVFHGEEAESGRGGFLALLKLFFADGKTDFICSDNSWRAAAVPQRKDGRIERASKVEKVEIFDNSAGPCKMTSRISYPFMISVA